jgi:hypothetical protein
MSLCFVCGEETPLVVAGRPLCLSCDRANLEELLIRGKFKRGSASVPPRAERMRVQHRKAQANVIKFLDTDLDLAFILLDIEKTRAEYHSDRSGSALAKAQSALKEVRRLMLYIEDADAAERIRLRAEALEFAVMRFNGRGTD